MTEDEIAQVLHEMPAIDRTTLLIRAVVAEQDDLFDQVRSVIDCAATLAGTLDAPKKDWLAHYMCNVAYDWVSRWQ
jgi:hypothetical protein